MAGEVLAGVDAVVSSLIDRLSAPTGVAAELELLEAAYGRPVPAPTDPAEPDLWSPPRLYSSSDRGILEPDDYPAVLVVPQDSLAARVEDITEGRVDLVIPYRLRIWVFARHDGYEEVQAAIRRLGLAVTQCLFRRLHLTATQQILLQGWRSSWSAVGVDEADDSRSFAGWWIELIVDQREKIGDVMVAPGTPGDPLTIEVRVHPEAD